MTVRQDSDYARMLRELKRSPYGSRFPVAEGYTIRAIRAGAMPSGQKAYITKVFKLIEHARPTQETRGAPGGVRALRKKENLSSTARRGSPAAAKRPPAGSSAPPPADPPPLPPDGRKRSEAIINGLAGSTPARPRPFSLWSHSRDVTEVSDYVSWPSLTDRSFTGRHLPPAGPEYVRSLPPDQPFVSPREFGQVTGLFKRGKQLPSERSSLLFPLFAQWFTDSFIRTDPNDRRRNSSNHHIDMCQIYGLSESTARILRSGEGGRLKSQIVDGREFPPYLFDVVRSINEEVMSLAFVEDGRYKAIIKGFPDRTRHYFATGLERGNSTPGYTALSTLFLREHNRICGELANRQPNWDDERLFQTARMIVIVLLIKIVIEEYIDHISAEPPNTFKFDNSFAEDQNWYRTNWIAIEFDLLYRWHSAIPDKVRVGQVEYGPKQFLLNNRLLIDRGVGGILQDVSMERSCKIGLVNTPDFLLQTEYMALKMSRDFKLRSFNDYRKQFRLDPIKSFQELTDDKGLRAKLKGMYKSIDNVEFLVGLYAEQPKSKAPRKPLFGSLMTRMLAADAFSQALTNPLLSKERKRKRNKGVDESISGVYNADTFTQYGLDLIGKTRCLNDLATRNVTDLHHPRRVSMDYRNSGGGG